MRNRSIVVVLLGTISLALISADGCSVRKPSKCRNPQYVPALKAQGARFYQNGDMINALKILKDAAECEPKDGELYYLIGLVSISGASPIKRSKTSRSRWKWKRATPSRGWPWEWRTCH